MIGRAAQGRPWIFREIAHYLTTGQHLPEPAAFEIKTILLGHLENLYQFYGEHTGSMVARKHVSWYSRGQTGSARFRDQFNRLEKPHEQILAVETFLVIPVMEIGEADVPMADRPLDPNQMDREVSKVHKVTILHPQK